MLSTNPKNYERIIISEKEFERRYDKHSVYNPENSINSCEANLINCCEARAPKANKIARALETSDKENLIANLESSKQKQELKVNHYD